MFENLSKMAFKLLESRIVHRVQSRDDHVIESKKMQSKA